MTHEEFVQAVAAVVHLTRSSVTVLECGYFFLLGCFVGVAFACWYFGPKVRTLQIMLEARLLAPCIACGFHLARRDTEARFYISEKPQ